MPYPVPPPSLPPVVHYLRSEEFSQSVSGIVPEQATMLVPEDASTLAIEDLSAPSLSEPTRLTLSRLNLPRPSLSRPSLSRTPVHLCSTQAGGIGCLGAVPETAKEELIENVARNAEPLGSPVEINLPSVQPDSSAAEPPTSANAQASWRSPSPNVDSPLIWSNTVLPLLELEALAQAVAVDSAEPEQATAQSDVQPVNHQPINRPQQARPASSVFEFGTGPLMTIPELSGALVPISVNQYEVGSEHGAGSENSAGSGDEPRQPSNGQAPANAPANSPSSATQSPTPTAPGSQLPQTAPSPPVPETPGRRNRRNRNRPNNGLPIDQVTAGEVVELTADRQEYDEVQRVFTAEGHAVMRYQQSVLAADRIQVNLPNRIAVADGNVGLTRGQQVVQGDRLVYNFVQNQGTVTGARGILFVPAVAGDFTPTLPTDVSAGAVASQQLTDRLTAAQPLQVTGSTGGINVAVSSGLPGSNASNNPVGTGITGNLNRLRFEADQVDFAGDFSVGTNVRITNDPFSPPELELRSPRVTFTRETETRSVIRAQNPRIVFDQNFSLPTLQNQIVLDKRQRNSPLVSFGYDERDRGGFYIERPFNVITSPAISFSLTPQFLVQRAFDQRDFSAASDFGLVAELDAGLGLTTSLVGIASFSSLDFQELDNNLRASVRLRQQLFNHTLALEYSFRDRLFNGSLGFQTVHSSYGFVITSPTFALDKKGTSLSYQAGIQRINADTDFSSLLPPGTSGNQRVDLTRYQASAAVSHPFYLWFGRVLPSTPTEGLRYTPNPVLPYIVLSTGVRGVYSAYSSGDTQAELTGSVGLSGQFGHFSKPFLDYTAFSITYSATALSGRSPFLFDRVADQQVITLGFTQQIYGPFRFGIVTSINLDRDKEIDTTYTLEYSRRTYAVLLSYSPVREAAALTLRISDFNFTGSPGRFSGIGSDVVTGGVQRTSY